MASSRSTLRHLPPWLLKWQHNLCETAAVFLTCCWLVQTTFADPALLFPTMAQLGQWAAVIVLIVTIKNKDATVLHNTPNFLDDYFSLLKFTWSCHKVRRAIFLGFHMKLALVPTVQSQAHYWFLPTSLNHDNAMKDLSTATHIPVYILRLWCFSYLHQVPLCPYHSCIWNLLMPLLWESRVILSSYHSLIINKKDTSFGQVHSTKIIKLGRHYTSARPN